MKKSVFRVTLAASIAALSIIIDILVKIILPLPIENFGVPFYAIPLVVGSIVLGPIYGGIAAVVSDIVGFYLAPKGNFNFMFSLSAMAWGIIPSIFLKIKSNKMSYLITIFFTHVVATILNTAATMIFVSEKAALGVLPLRLAMIPINVFILGHMSYIVVKRLINYGQNEMYVFEKML